MRLHKFQTADRVDMFIDLDRVEAILDQNTQNGSICTLLGLSCGIFYTVKGTYLEIAKLVMGEVPQAKPQPEAPPKTATTYRFPVPRMAVSHEDVDLLDILSVHEAGRETWITFRDSRPSLMVSMNVYEVGKLLKTVRGV